MMILCMPVIYREVNAGECRLRMYLQQESSQKKFSGGIQKVGTGTRARTHTQIIINQIVVTGRY